MADKPENGDRFDSILKAGFLKGNVISTTFSTR